MSTLFWAFCFPSCYCTVIARFACWSLYSYCSIPVLAVLQIRRQIADMSEDKGCL